ncbi:alpha/beta hydrolase [Actinosynnema sp. NPDC023658]|uniref:alpha/beta fold hydrolase n=1 Tax=Actinosynnema sp. NPDC023658 TaxID=3155465 RepID=UPI0033CEE081
MLSTKERSVDVAGIPVGYYVEGDGQGPELVLIHGGTGHPETSFASLLDHFTPRRTAIVPGYSGSHLTPLPDGEVDVDMLADQVLGVVKAAARGPVDLFGISTGAVVAAAAAGKEPDLIRRVVVLGGFVHYRQPWQRLLVRTWLRLAELDGNAFAEYTLLHVLSDEYLDSMSAGDRLRLRAGLMPSEGMVKLIELVSRVDISEHVRNIKAPTLVVGMKHDQLVPVRYAKQFHEAIPGSEYVEIDSGHAAAIEKPAELLKIVEEFLA